jgi:hypothetical protein
MGSAVFVKFVCPFKLKFFLFENPVIWGVRGFGSAGTGLGVSKLCRVFGSSPLGESFLGPEDWAAPYVTTLDKISIKNAMKAGILG